MPALYTIVDIETTGGRVTRDRITEIAAFKYDADRDCIVDEFVTLLNPEIPVPLHIMRLTGIHNRMVADAPKFYEVAKRFVEFTEGCVFVAHNVSFDYSFLKSEFKQLGYNYNRKRLCTVRLARQILPGHRSYSLGRICKDLNIKIAERHRAAGDARATVELFRKLVRNDTEGLIETAFARGKRETLLPPHLDHAAFEALPEATGVYYFLDKAGKIIYVGKAVNIKQRVLGHFGVNLGSRKAIRLKTAVHDVAYEVTGSELVALLLESHEIKTKKPRFNVAQKDTRGLFGLYDYHDQAGYRCLAIQRLRPGSQPLTTFPGMRSGKRYVDILVQRYGLCQTKAGLYEPAGPCFLRQVNRCQGACEGAEPPETYNQRVAAALEKLNVSTRNLAVVEQGREPGEQAVVLVENGQYLGFGYVPHDAAVDRAEVLKDYIQPYPDNRDVQRILNHHLRSEKKMRVLEF